MNVKKGLGFGIAACVILIAVVAGCLATKSDTGIGLQTEEILADGISGIEIMLSDNPVVIKQGGTDQIVLSLMNNDRSDSILSHQLENGLLTVNADASSQAFDLSLNPDRMQREVLEVTIPASADLSSLKIKTEDTDSVTLEKVLADSINISTLDGDVVLIGIDGEVDARTSEGTITAAADLSAEIVQDVSEAYTYQGTVGVEGGSGRQITVSSFSGNISFE